MFHHCWLQCAFRSAGITEEGPISQPHPQIHPISPRVAPLSPRAHPQNPKLNPVSRSVSGITTASQEAGAAPQGGSENGSWGAVMGPLTPSEQAPSVATTEAPPPEVHRLKEENSDLAQK